MESGRILLSRVWWKILPFARLLDIFVGRSRGDQYLLEDVLGFRLLETFDADW